MSNHSSEWLETYNKINNYSRKAQVDRDHILDSLEMVVTQQKEIRDQQQLINSLNEKTLTQSWQMRILEEAKTSLEERVIDLEHELVDKQSEIHELENSISNILLSKSWTITRPLRKLSKLIRKGK